MLNFLFEKRDELFFHKYNILGIKFKICKGKNLPTLADIRTYTMASQINRNLEKYRGYFNGKDVLIVGGGPSIKYLDQIPKNIIKIGINRAYQLENIEFDYLFIQDKFKKQEDIDGFINYMPNECKKFIGIRAKQNLIRRIRPSTISKIKNKEFYVLNNRRPQTTLLPIDVSMEPFAWFSGTGFGALQFCLFANAEKIYLAGFDCSNDGHAFSNDEMEYKQAHQYKHWLLFKEYKERLFEDAEIISINPVNLKNLFKNVYTQKFLDINPEIKDVEILKGDNI